MRTEIAPLSPAVEAAIAAREAVRVIIRHVGWGPWARRLVTVELFGPRAVSHDVAGETARTRERA